MLALKVVDEDEFPTEEQHEELEEYYEENRETLLKYRFSKESMEWFAFLIGCRGSFKKILDVGYIANHVHDDGPCKGNPMFEEYAYILNFDTGRLDYYDNRHPSKIRFSHPLTEDGILKMQDDWINNLTLGITIRQKLTPFAVTYKECCGL